MELRQAWTVLRKWWWLVLVSAIGAAGIAFIVTLFMTPKYLASATLYVDAGTKQSQPDLYGAEIFLSQNVETMSKRLVLRPVLERVIANLGLTESLTPEDLEEMISVKVNQRTQLIVLEVTDVIPERAAAIANEIPIEFNLRNKELLSARYASSKTSISEQIDTLQQEIDQLQAQLDAQKAAAVPDNAEISRLDSALAQLRITQANLFQSFESIRTAEASALSNLVIDEPALSPTEPISPNRPRMLLLAALVGMVLAVAAALVIEYFDDTLKSADDVLTQLGIATLGSILSFSGETADAGLISLPESRSAAAEAFRVLRTNIQFVSLDKPLRSLVVTSATPSEGKSTISANLAAAMAQAGLSVILIDADLRRPRLHSLFQLSNQVGLTSALMHTGLRQEEYLQETCVPHLRLVASGPLPPDPSIVLHSQAMLDLEQRLAGQADVLIFDTPPVLMMADTSILANRTDGVLLVVEARRTHREAVANALERLSQAGSRILGVVLNRVSMKSENYYAYYYYYTDDKGTHKRRRRHSAS